MSTILANNATLGYNTASSGSFTGIAVKSISSPEPEYAVTDVSGLADTSNIKLPGFVDNKQFSWEMYHTSTTKALLTSAVLLGAVIHYKITLSDSSTFTFDAIATGYKTKLERNGSIVYEVTAQITGDCVLA